MTDPTPAPPPSRRLTRLASQVLEETLDEELQAIVTEAARALGVPIALVSIMLERIQFFRAFHGLPPDLAIVRATSRDASLCRFVVQSGEPFAVEDAAADPTLPRGLIDQYGIRSYLGVPVRVDGEILGSLCVIDTTPRRFADGDRERLRALADRVQTRLARLAASRARTPLGLLEAATGPVFAELRNELAPIQYGVEGARVAAFELRTLLTAIEMGAEQPYLMHSLAPAREAMATLRDRLDAIESAAGRVVAGIGTLERAASTPWDDPHAGDVIAEADALARHVTANVGGVAWSDETTTARPLLTPLPIASALIAALLSWLTDRMRSRGLRGPIRAAARDLADAIEITLAVPGLDGDDIEAIRRRFTRLGVEKLARLDADPPTLRLALPVHITGAPA
ncbi:MAG: GAF domain-containing protein [bacterium]|nr:GAF domain-containing protein [Myxococcales bacterium]